MVSITAVVLTLSAVKICGGLEKKKNEPGWWFSFYPSEKYDFVNWNDDIPNISEIKVMFQLPPIRY